MQQLARVGCECRSAAETARKRGEKAAEFIIRNFPRADLFFGIELCVRGSRTTAFPFVNHGLTARERKGIILIEQRSPNSEARPRHDRDTSGSRGKPFEYVRAFFGFLFAAESDDV